MKKVIAGQIAEGQLQSYMKKGHEVLKRLLVESDHKFITRDNVEYQLRVNALYDDKEDLTRARIMVAVDDQKFWSTFAPLCRDDFYYLND